MNDMDHPAGIMARLVAIEGDLATRQNSYESAASGWYTAKRDIEREVARAVVNADLGGTVTERKAQGALDAYDVEGAASEAEYEALKAVVRVLETRATICQSLLRAHGRIG